ncbi:MAG: Crp/Fnr family transcriptional regulator [Hyphomicrobiales bacterium]|nr:Crp/Fnr family transcriptional regulator [Hyphomicrobiales bacterium]
MRPGSICRGAETMGGRTPAADGAGDLLETSLVAASLKRTELFDTAGPKVVEALAVSAQSRKWSNGELLFATGDTSDGFHIVMDGLVRLTLITEDGGELTVRDAGPGEIFGEIGALDGGPRSATATIASPRATTAFLPSNRFAAILRQNPSFLFDISLKLCRRLRETTQQLEGIALYPLSQRLARFLYMRGEVHGRPQKDGRRSMSLALSQSELATVLGASRPKINAALIDLERQGCIERHGATVHYNPETLAAAGQIISPPRDVAVSTAGTVAGKRPHAPE